jgi:hypothetical protein
MPDRVVRQDILTSDPVNMLSWAAEVFYRRLMSLADDYGRYEARPSLLRASLYPLKLDRVSEPDVVKWMGECSEAGLVRVYTVNAKEYVEIQKFGQRLRAMKSRYPPPTVNGGQPAMATADNRCQLSADVDSRHPTLSDADSGRLKRNESETESESESETEEKGSPLSVDIGTVIYDIEQDLLKNAIIFEQICMAAGRDLETGKFVLAKYHLTLQENEQYPKARPALVAGFKKWLMTEKSTNGKQKTPNSTNRATATTTGHTGL